MLLATTASIFRRHLCVFRDLAWSVLQLCDPRVPEGGRARIADLYDATPSCCMASGANRSLKEHGISGAQLFESASGTSSSARGCVVALSVCDVEWKHGQSRRGASDSGQTRISTFFADYMDARLLHDAKVQTHEALLRALCARGARAEPHAGAPRPPLAGRDGMRLRASSAIQIYGWDHLATARGRGEKVNPPSSAWHQRVRQAWFDERRCPAVLRGAGSP